MNNKETTYEELLEACVTQNEFAKYDKDHKQVDDGQIAAELEILRKLHTYAMCKRRIAKIQELQQKINNNITNLIDGLK